MNTLDTTDDARRRAHHLEGRPDGVGRGRDAARDHAVGQPGVHHHRAEVRGVDDPVVRQVDGHALVRPQARRSRRRTPRASGLVAGSTTAAASMSTPSWRALARIWPSSPSRVSRAIPRESTWSAARRMRSSAPSGSTMCAPAARARSTRSCSNISGVTAPLGGTDPVADERVEVGVVGLVDERHGARILRADSAVMPPLDAVERGRDRHRPLTGRHDRQPHVEAVDQQVDLRRELEPTVEHHPGQRRQGAGMVREKHAEHDVVSVTRHDHGGTLEEPVDDVRHRHRRDDAGRGSRGRAAPRHRARACRRRPSRGRPRSAPAAGRPRAAPDRHRCRAAPRTSSSTSSCPPSGTWLTTTPATWAWPARAAETAARHARRELAGVPVAGRHDEHQRGAQVGGDASRWSRTPSAPRRR